MSTPAEARWELTVACPGCGESIELLSWFELNHADSTDDLFAESMNLGLGDGEAFVTECPHCERAFDFVMRRP